MLPSPRNLQNRYFFGWSKEEIDILCNGFPPMSQYRKVIGSVLVALLMSRCHPNCLISTVSHLIKLGWVLFSGVNVTFFVILLGEKFTGPKLPPAHLCQNWVTTVNQVSEWTTFREGSAYKRWQHWNTGARAVGPLWRVFLTFCLFHFLSCWRFDLIFGHTVIKLKWFNLQKRYRNFQETSIWK